VVARFTPHAHINVLIARKARHTPGGQPPWIR
jgi:hypothetical protein